MDTCPPLSNINKAVIFSELICFRFSLVGLPIQNENKRIYSRTSGNRVLHRVRQRLDGDDPFG